MEGGVPRQVTSEGLGAAGKFLAVSEMDGPLPCPSMRHASTRSVGPCYCPSRNATYTSRISKHVHMHVCTPRISKHVHMHVCVQSTVWGTPFATHETTLLATATQTWKKLEASRLRMFCHRRTGRLGKTRFRGGVDIPKQVATGQIPAPAQVWAISQMDRALASPSVRHASSSVRACCLARIHILFIARQWGKQRLQVGKTTLRGEGWALPPCALAF